MTPEDLMQGYPDRDEPAGPFDDRIDVWRNLYYQERTRASKMQDAVIKLEKQVRELQEGMEKRSEFINAQCKAAMDAVPPSADLTYIDPAQYLTAYIRVIMQENTELKSLHAALHPWRYLDQAAARLESLERELSEYHALAEKVAGLNPQLGEIGPGMLAQLVGMATRLQCENRAMSEQLSNSDFLSPRVHRLERENAELKERVTELEKEVETVQGALASHNSSPFVCC